MPKTLFADATLLRHPIPGAKLSLWTDARTKAVGGSLMQLCQNNWESVAFLSVKLSKSQREMDHIIPPTSKRFVERLHRVLKSALMAHENIKWTETLPAVLLGLRVAVKPDINASSAEIGVWCFPQITSRDMH
ncbi:transposon Ty3-I Gag-Pol polyprotein [Trichonephila clavipes]|nr:transposon Ty3-I Gag-Pol polyprotein [Trichonephila clavipes]